MISSVLKKTELYNPDVMKKLLRHPGIATDEKKKLKKYYSKSQNANSVTVIYELGKDWKASGYGRVYVEKSIGLSAFYKDMRNVLAASLYHDIDMVNAHPTILAQVCKKKGWECNKLDSYINDREQILKEIMELYGASRDDAKELMIRLLYLGEVQNWQKDNQFLSTISTDTKNNEFIVAFQNELQMIAENVWKCNPEIASVYKKKRIDIKSKYSGCLSVFLQTEEHKILMAIDKCLFLNGRKMDVLIFDGGMVQRIPDEKEFPVDLLRKCEKYVKESLGYIIPLAEKPIVSSIKFEEDALLGFVPSNITIDDTYAAVKFVELMDGKIKAIGNDLVVFDPTTGLWTDDKRALRRSIHNFDTELKLKQVDEFGSTVIHNYSGNEFKMMAMLKSVAMLCPDDLFFNQNIDSSRGKLLFEDGIYDFKTNTFTPGFDHKIVFVKRIQRPFPKERDEDMIKYAKKVLFEDPFLESQKEEYGGYLLKGVARALYGDYRAKSCYFCIGAGNAGKSVIIDALKAAFQEYVGTFNGASLQSNKMAGADSAKNLSWIIPIHNNRISISSELNMDNNIDGNIIKSIVSGGDTLIVRQNYTNETPIIARTTLFVFVNDIPKIEPCDKPILDRIKTIDYKCTFVPKPNPENENERLEDPTIKDNFMYNDKYKDALVHVCFDAFQDYMKTGHPLNPLITRATEQWIANGASIQSVVESEYEITKDQNDCVTVSEMKYFLSEKKKMKMSPTKIEQELISLKLIQHPKKVNGKTTRVWLGIRKKEREDENGIDLF